MWRTYHSIIQVSWKEFQICPPTEQFSTFMLTTFLHFAFSLHDRVLICIGTVFTMISGRVPESLQCNWCYCSAAWEPKDHRRGSHRDSPDSQNHFKILCTVDDWILKVFTILYWRTLLWNCSTIWWCVFFVLFFLGGRGCIRRLVNSPSSFASEKLCPSKMSCYWHFANKPN